MEAKNNVIVLDKGEDVAKLDGLADNSLKELLKYQGDSSAFDSDDQKALLKNMPPDLSDKQRKLVEGLFPSNEKSIINKLEDSIQEGFIKIADERRKNRKPIRQNEIVPFD
jgi:hypothetical protein